MKLFVCLWALYAVANAGFLGLGGGSGSGHAPASQRGHGGPEKVFRVKVINEGHSGSYGQSQDHHHGHNSGPQLIKVIHQESSGFSNGFGGHGHHESFQSGGQGSHGGYGSSNGARIIKVIYQDSSNSHGAVSGHDHSAAPQVIKVIHENSAGNGGFAASGSAVHSQVSGPAKIIRVIHEHSQPESVPQATGSFANSAVVAPENSYLPPVQAAGSAVQQQFSAPASVIRVIHSQAPSQSGVQAASFPNAAVIAPDNNYLAPVQAPAQNFNLPLPQLNAASSQNIADSNQYLPPLQQYIPPSSSFAAPAHVPAQSYGPPSQ